MNRMTMKHEKVYPILFLASFLLPHTGSGFAQDAGEAVTTAWRAGRFQIDVAGVIARSDVVLAHPNAEARQAMPLGNGRLGVALWSAEGFTTQLNRADTLHLSAG
jgi:hypothetical protein